MKTSTFDKVKIGIFAGALAVTFIACVVHKPSEFSERENRFLAAKPKFTFAKVADGSFMKDYESYITDQIPGRDGFTAVKTLAETGRGSLDENGVYFGKEGYLIGKYDASLFENEKAEGNIKALGAFSREYSEKFGGDHFSVVMVPSSSEILKDKLPTLAVPYDQREFIKNAETAVGSEYFIDVSSALNAHKDEYIYYRTDHHYTTLGAYYVYEAWRKHLDASAVKLTDFTDEEVPDFYGTYDSKVNTALAGGVTADTINIYHNKLTDSAKMTWDGKEDKVYTGIYDETKLSVKDKYSVFFGGNHGITDIDTGSGKEGKLLIIKDSYAHSLAPFALSDYGRIIMVDLRYFNKSLKKYIEENGISDILVLYSTADFAEDANMAKLLR